MEFTIFHHNYIATLIVFNVAFVASRKFGRTESPVQATRAPLV